MRFNVAIAKLIELATHLTRLGAQAGSGAPREGVEGLVLMLAPLAPHLAEELWSRLGHPESVTHQPYPTADPAWTRREQLTIPVQVKGKLRATITVEADVTDAALESAARADPKIISHLAEMGEARAIVVPGRLVNFVPARRGG